MKFLKHLKSFAVAGAVAATVSMASAPAEAAKARLTAADPDWTGGLVTCRLIKIPAS